MNTSTLPRLVVSLTSPYARKVRIAALELSVPFVMVVDVPWNEDTGVIKLNPLGKVPVWVTAGGNAIADSRVIVEYLDTLSSARLFPGEPLDRIAVKQLEALADGIMDASLCLFAERKKRPQELQHPWWIDRQFSKVHRGLEHLDARISRSRYFFGGCLTIADIAVACALGYVGLRFSADFDWQSQYPNLANFYKDMMQSASFSNTVPVV